jgi:TonB-dependent SusC/RagA subfamily outer membrane receptor
MMEDWTDIIGEELGNISEPLPADDWNVLQQKYAAARRRRKAAVFAWVGGVTSAAAAVALALLLIRPSEPFVLEGDMVAEAEVLEEVPVAVPVQTDSVVVDESRSSVLTPVTSPSSAKSHIETEDVLLADADSEGMIQVVKDTADVTEVLVADVLPEVSKVAEPLKQDGQIEQDDLSALEGQVAGVSIRGAKSVRGGDGPVYVVDGFVVSASEASAIDPEDIESVEILKGASAASVYGSRSSGGVVVITTKNGGDSIELNTVVGYGSRPRVSIGLAGGGVLSGARAFAQDMTPPMMDSENMPEGQPPIVDDPEPPVDTTVIGGGSQMGMMLRKERAGYSDSYQHDMPVSVGVSARIMLSRRFSINTGLNYTLYSSMRERSYSSGKVTERERQNVHYLGIPLRCDWLVVNRRYFTFYMGVGGQVDKCVYARVGDERLHEKDFLFSLTGAAGLQYNITNKVGLYLEPDFSLRLNKGTLDTYRHDHFGVISARAGLRFNF